VRAGEESASLVESLDTIAEEDDVEIDNLTEALSRTFEPIMILVMGGLVGYLVTTVYGSIYWLYGRIR
jgi:type IV pilus assembly protein PilC